MWHLNCKHRLFWNVECESDIIRRLFHTQNYKIFEDNPIDIGKLSKIRHLRLVVETGLLAGNFPQLSDVLSLIDRPTQPTALRSIDIILQCCSAAPEKLQICPECPSDEAWRLLTLSNLRSKHPQLTRAYINIDVDFASYLIVSKDERKAIVERLSRQLYPLIRTEDNLIFLEIEVTTRTSFT